MKSTRISRIGALALLLLCGAGIVWSRGQEASTPSEPQKANSDHRRTSPGHELVHESREAAGEEKDEMEAFKQSPSLAWISRKLHVSVRAAYWISFVFNFAVIGAVIIWAGRKFLPGIFRDRTAAIQRAMQEAQKASQEARRKLAEIESRLQKLDVDIGMMRDAAEKEGVAEEARIKADAEEDARKIIAAAEQEIDAAIKAARRELTAHAADLAVGLAQKQIHVDASTDQALIRNFVDQLGSTPESSRKDGN